MEGKDSFTHFLPCIFECFSQAALWSQTLVEHKSNKTSFFPFASRHHPVVMLLESAVNAKPAPILTPPSNTQHSAVSVSCPLQYMMEPQNQIAEYTCCGPAHSGGVGVGGAGNKYPSPRSAISMNIEQPQRAV